MRLLVKLLLDSLIIGLFLYSKLLPHKDRLTGRYRSTFEFFNRFFSPILNFFRARSKPFQVGTGLAVDMSQIVLLIILLVLTNLF